VVEEEYAARLICHAMVDIDSGSTSFPIDAILIDDR
jgi:hypothetical protein